MQVCAHDVHVCDYTDAAGMMQVIMLSDKY